LFLSVDYTTGHALNKPFSSERMERENTLFPSKNKKKFENFLKQLGL